MDGDRFDEVWEGYGLEFVMDEDVDVFGQSVIIRIIGQCFLVEIDGYEE